MRKIRLTVFQEEYNQQDADPKNLIPRLEDELAEIRRALMDGVQKLIDRGQRLDELVRKTQSLQITVSKPANILASLFPLVVGATEDGSLRWVTNAKHQSNA